MVIKTLVVDDERALLEQAKEFISKGNREIEVHTAISVDDALEMLDEQDFDVIVSDYQMAGKDGIEFLKVLREEKNEDIPFIMLTGKGKEEVAMKALNLGANRYLQKVGEPKPWYNILAQAIEQEFKQFKAEKRILESEERYRKLFERIRDGLLIIDAKSGKIKDANPRLQDLLGYSKEELVSKKLWKIDSFKKIADEREGFEELIDKGYNRYQDLNLKTEEGREVPVEVVINTYDAGGKKVVQCKIIDISERKRRKSLEEGVMRFRKLSEASPNAIILVNRETGKIKDVNQVAEELLEMPREDIIGREYFDFHLEEERGYVKEIFDHQEDGELTSSKELYIKNSYDEEIPVQMRASYLELAGEEIIYFALNDISKRKEAEEREEFLHSLLRHELRNKIHVSKGNLELLKESSLSEDKKEFLDDAIESYEEGMDIIEKVRDLKKLGKDEVKEVLIGGGVLKRSVDQYRSEAEYKDIKIELDMNDVTAQVKGGELLPEVFSNLISNSIKHSYGDKIVVSVEENKDEVICKVEDDGMGIPAEKKDEIFEKGFTTVNSSSGLGLFLVKDIVSHYGGSVEVKDSELGGARFDIHLQKV